MKLLTKFCVILVLCAFKVERIFAADKCYKFSDGNNFVTGDTFKDVQQDCSKKLKEISCAMEGKCFTVVVESTINGKTDYGVVKDCEWYEKNNVCEIKKESLEASGTRKVLACTECAENLCNNNCTIVDTKNEVDKCYSYDRDFKAPTLKEAIKDSHEKQVESKCPFRSICYTSVHKFLVSDSESGNTYMVKKGCSQTENVCDDLTKEGNVPYQKSVLGCKPCKETLCNQNSEIVDDKITGTTETNKNNKNNTEQIKNGSNSVKLPYILTCLIMGVFFRKYVDTYH